jgi:hypothetical protein
MLLQMMNDEKLQDGQATVGATGFEFASTPTSIMVNAFKVPLDRVATFAVKKLQLTQAEACMEQYKLQATIQATLEDYLSEAASEMHTVQVTKLSVDKAGIQCRHSLLSSFSAATAEVTMLVVFKEGTESTISLEKFKLATGSMWAGIRGCSGKKCS